MRGLLLRLSKLDEGAESAVRIIAYFDALTRNHATAEVLVRATANLAECAAGMRGSDGVAITHAYSSPPAEEASGAVRLERSFGAPPGAGVVWLDREGGRDPLDEMVLERMAVAAEIVWERRNGPGGVSRTPALVRNLINPRLRAADRLAAAQSLGLGQRIYLIAIASAGNPAPQSHAISQHGGTRASRVTVDHATDVVILESSHSTDPDTAAIRRFISAKESAGFAGPSTPADAADMWGRAKHALEFAAQRNGPTVVRAEDLGALEALASVPSSEIEKNSDVRALMSLRDEVGGRDLILAVQSMSRTGSLRRTAEEMRLHHSSVSARLRRAEDKLGFSVQNPDGLFRARLALTLWELLRGRSR